MHFWTSPGWEQATSALDTKSERLVQAALDSMAKERAATTLVIAHRLSTLVSMDKIVVLEKGALVEAGTHSELAQKEGGLFREMQKGQSVEGTDGGTAAAEAAEAAAAAAEEEEAANAAASAKASAVRQAQLVAAATTSPMPTSSSSTMPTAPSTSRRQQLRRVWGMQRPDYYLFPLGMIAALGGGCISPALALVYGGAISIFFSPDEDYVRRNALLYLGCILCKASNQIHASPCPHCVLLAALPPRPTAATAHLPC